jgi:hypothetical protein
MFMSFLYIVTILDNINGVLLVIRYIEPLQLVTKRKDYAVTVLHFTNHYRTH